VVNARGLPKVECDQVCGSPGPSPPAPAEKNIVQLAISVPDLSTLVTALKAGGLIGSLSGAGPFTVFAPSNEAFAALPPATLKSLLDPKNIKQLQSVLEYHVAAGSATYSKDLKNQERIKTLEGESVEVTLLRGDVFIDRARVVTPDNAASNGVVHIINQVLMPLEPPSPGPAPPGPPVEPPKWYNQTYSYPASFNGTRALIIEDPLPYNNGPSVYSDSNLLGASGMAIVPGMFDTEAGCTPVPADSPFASSSSVYPAKLIGEYAFLKRCLLGCDWKEVEATGIDPCNAGSLPKGVGLSNSVMSCFNVNGTVGHGGGACGYNCTNLKRDAVTGQLVGCARAQEAECEIYCDTRNFPSRG
jgi:uncharacterized surface protein with fasciclin (FAS1) repeats